MKAHQCEECKRRFQTPRGLRQHERRCLGTDKFILAHPDSWAANRRHWTDIKFRGGGP